MTVTTRHVNHWAKSSVENGIHYTRRLLTAEAFMQVTQLIRSTVTPCVH